MTVIESQNSRNSQMLPINKYVTILRKCLQLFITLSKITKLILSIIFKIINGGNKVYRKGSVLHAYIIQCIVLIGPIIIIEHWR